MEIPLGTTANSFHFMAIHYSAWTYKLWQLHEAGVAFLQAGVSKLRIWFDLEDG